MVRSNLIELNTPTQWLLWCIMAYFAMNGAQLWETANLVPAWTTAPPASLKFFQSPYGIDLNVFWIVTHSVHEVIFIVALILNWRDKRRRIPMLWLFAAHLGVRVWTILYFAPTIIWFQSLPISPTVDRALVEKATLWRNLNYVRVGLFIIINVCMVFLIRSPKTNQS